VDVHPVVFDDSGAGRQAGPDGSSFDYPADCFTTGVIDGHLVPCLSVRQQLAFHAGYEPRPHDLADLEVLRSLRS
jgi:lincosamide nucleotidyltransferase A/C/D/E